MYFSFAQHYIFFKQIFHYIMKISNNCFLSSSRFHAQPNEDVSPKIRNMLTRMYGVFRPNLKQFNVHNFRITIKYSHRYDKRFTSGAVFFDQKDMTSSQTQINENSFDRHVFIKAVMDESMLLFKKVSYISNSNMRYNI